MPCSRDKTPDIPKISSATTNDQKYCSLPNPNGYFSFASFLLVFTPTKSST